MEEITNDKLLNDRRIVDEIHRHLWLESEKAGYDIGFDKAKEDWLKNYAKAWLDYHLPQEQHSKKPAQAKKETIERKTAQIKRRSAKSYIDVS